MHTRCYGPGYTRRFAAGAALALAASVAGAQAADFNVAVNGRYIDTGDQPPVVRNGHLLVPLAAISRSLGAYLEWRPGTRSIFGREGDHEFLLPVNSATATVDGEVRVLDAPARIIDGRTMVPLRFVATALDVPIRYEPATRTVSVGEVDTGTTVASASAAAQDMRPPLITTVSPLAGAQVSRRPRIAVRFQDRGGSGVDVRRVRLFLNGVDVTRRAVVTPSGLTYDARLAPGRHVARVTVEDMDGNVAQSEWTFRVRGGAQVSGVDEEPAIWPPEPPATPSSR